MKLQQQNSRVFRWLNLSALLCSITALSACGGGGGGGGSGNGSGGNSGVTFQIQMTGLELEDTRNSQVVDVGNLPANGATITKQ